MLTLSLRNNTQSQYKLQRDLNFAFSILHSLKPSVRPYSLSPPLAWEAILSSLKGRGTAQRWRVLKSKQGHIKKDAPKAIS